MPDALHNDATPHANGGCVVHGCDNAAEIEVTWERLTAFSIGWPDEPGTRRYCSSCFDSRNVRHPWDQADIVRRIDAPSRQEVPHV